LERAFVSDGSEVEDLERRQQEAAQQQELEMLHAAAEPEGRPAGDGPATFVRDAPKVGRNDPCPCGSTKKYKQCHGKLS